MTNDNDLNKPPPQEPGDNPDTLQDRIRAAQEKAEPEKPKNESAMAGSRAGGEFLAHVIAGAICGWAFDHWFGTAPIMIVVMILAGFGSGLYRANKILTAK